MSATPSQLLWQPSAAAIASSNMSHFMKMVTEKYNCPFNDYASLHQWSVEQPEQFWASVWEFCGVKASQPYQQILVDGNKMPGARWFVGAKLNFAENLMRYNDEKLAIIYYDERDIRRTFTYAQLHHAVQNLAAAFRHSGVTVGDRIVGYLPNMPETVIAMLAATSLGAIWSGCSPDFGISGVVDRFGQIKPKILLTTDGYYYNGKTNDTLQKVNDIVKQLPTLEKIIVVPNLKSQPDLTTLPQAVLYAAYIAAAPQHDLTFTELPFDHPVYILYSSGTTGVPKCIVHSAGGTLLQHLKELILHTDLTTEDTFFYYTTCTWMMWHWLISGLATGATLVLYDGSPFYPGPNVLFDLIDEEGITVFGTSAKYISAVEKEKLIPRETHSLTTLKTILSTGSPLLPENFDFVYSKIKADLRLSSISGGTDIVSCFALGHPNLPVYCGELQCIGLGLDVDIFDETGHSLREQAGELVCRAPFPCMPIYFWNDANGEKYHQAYFAKFPNIWAHGDFAEITTHQGLIIHGRSDAVLNPGGVRIGTAEIYRQVEQFDEVLESLAIGQDWQGDVRIILFVVLRAGHKLTPQLVSSIKQKIKDNTTPRHIPAKILQVQELPRTANGKLVELAVREVVHGRPVKNLDALANPGALAQFKDLPDLQTN